MLNMQREHFIPIVHLLYVVNGFASFAKLCQNYGIAVGHSRIGLSVVNVSGLFLHRLSLCNLLHFMFLVLVCLLHTVLCEFEINIKYY